MSAMLQAGVGVIGVGKYVPGKCVTNQMLEAWTGVPAARIVERIGIETRYIVEDHETASGMSATAAREALQMSGIDPERIALIVGCTFTGDYVYPAMACKVQALIKARNAGAFDLMANCTGFQVGLTVASDRMTCDPQVEYALVLGTALQSRFINWKDPDSAIYFGDGAGAAVLGRVPEGYGLLASEIFSNGKVFDAVRMRGGGSSYPLRPENIHQGLQYYELNGLEVWKQVVQYQPVAIDRSLAKIGKTVQDVDFFIFHQANLRLIEFLMARMKQPMNKTCVNVAAIGNTADASIAIALCDAVQSGRLKRGDLVVISGVGAGFTFGSTVMRWY
ncbi:MAG: ketoacyl-ACP synthase III [Candidatus Omnitrophica bacterium]|nr:ketoacyl-ACP synthase III [Candidatus Omnitrophota bacterium]